MNIRNSLSIKLRETKKLGGYQYDDLIEGTGCSKSSIRYALNGGDKVSLEVFQKLFDHMETYVEIDIERGYIKEEQLTPYFVGEVSESKGYSNTVSPISSIVEEEYL